MTFDNFGKIENNVIVTVESQDLAPCMDMNKENLINLCSLEQGKKASIVQIDAGSKATKRLVDLGLTPDTEIEIIRKTLFCGPMEVKVRGSSLVLGKQIAEKILVKQL